MTKEYHLNETLAQFAAVVSDTRATYDALKHARGKTAPAVSLGMWSRLGIAESMLAQVHVAAGRSGANANLNHPQRALWEATRDAFQRAFDVK